MSDITEFRLPQLAASVTSVRLGVWLKQEGDRVQAGEPIAEVETDKTNVELEAPTSGVVRAIQVAAGTDGLEAGVLLAIIADAADGETAAPVAHDVRTGPGRRPGGRDRCWFGRRRQTVRRRAGGAARAGPPSPGADPRHG